MTGEQVQPISDERLADIEDGRKEFPWHFRRHGIDLGDFDDLVARMRAAEAERDDLLDAAAELTQLRKKYRARRAIEAHARRTARFAEAEVERLRAKVARVVATLAEWGAIGVEGEPFSDQDFAEAIYDNGAWRLSRDLRADLADEEGDR